MLALWLPRAAPALAANAKSGQGNMTVSPTSLNAGASADFAFQFRSGGRRFNSGSQATLLIPAGWPAPQTNNPAGQGFVGISSVLNGSTASLNGVAGSGPWTLTLSFSSPNQGGFNLDYKKVNAPANSGIYSFTTKSMQNGGVLTTLRSGSPAVTVNNVTKTNTSIALSSGLNPSTYGDWVALSAVVTSAGTGTVSGTVTFKEGDTVLGVATVNSQGRAALSTNRFSVPDSPCSLTAEYNGDAVYNPSQSAALQQTVNPVTLSISGLRAASKAYDAGTSAVLDLSGVLLGGALAGDDVALDTSAASVSFADPNVGAQKSVTVAGLALQGVDGGNYVLGTVPALLADITRAPLTVTAMDTNRAFGAANPVFTALYNGFVGGENTQVLGGSPAFSTAATPLSPIAGGPYPILVTNGTLTAGNYAFSFVPGWLTIVPGPGQPHKILSISRHPSGGMTLVCGGAAGQSYLLQASTNLATGPWTTITTNTTDVSGAMTCTDSEAMNYQFRFYRTALP
jgi:hypothetical protein